MTIADAEIEIISDANLNDLPNGNPNPSKPAEPIIVDVHSASAYGDLQKLRCFVERDGHSLSKPDGNGYYALQWAALNNYADVAQYIIEHGGDVNAADNTQQAALHWAAVRGSMAVSDVLLQSGAWIEASDLNGYRAVHVAAQYGQTAFLNHIVAKHGADFDAPDNDGRSPLHWAAYKGFADTVRLLLFWNACQGRQDKEGAGIDTDVPGTSVVRSPTRVSDVVLEPSYTEIPPPRRRASSQRIAPSRRSVDVRPSPRDFGPALQEPRRSNFIEYDTSGISEGLPFSINPYGSFLSDEPSGVGAAALADFFGVPAYAQVATELVPAGPSFLPEVHSADVAGPSAPPVGSPIDSASPSTGCTPLHWAAIRGNTEACNVLVQAGTKQELTVKDKSGFTPVQLASDRGQKHAAIILSNATRVSGIFCGYGFCNGKLAKIGYAPILLAFVVVLVVLFINSVLDAPNFTKVTAVVALWGWTGVSLAVVSLFMFYRCSSKDPGYIKPRFESSLSNEGVDDALLSIDPYNSPIWTGNWSQLCPTCKIIRPLRSKHCPTCKRCVDQFDHHCPWISNCVGKKNKWDFFVFLCLGCLTSLLGAVIAVYRMWTGSPVKPSSGRWMHHMVTEHPGAVSFLLMDAMLLAGASALTIAQACQIARNITTNEKANSVRYSYLRGPDGRFRNPYNLGCKKNCTDFLVHGYTNDDEIAWPSLHQAVR